MDELGCMSDFEVHGPPGRCFPAAPNVPQQIVISPDGQNAYVLDDFGSGLTVYARDVATGLLLPILDPSGCIRGVEEAEPGVCAGDPALRGEPGAAVATTDGNVYVTTRRGIVGFARIEE